MAIERSFELFIKTTADLKAAQESKKALTDAIAEAKRMGTESLSLEAELLRVNVALAGEGASAVKMTDHLKAAIAATKAMHGDTAGLEAELKRVQQSAGLKGDDSKGFAALAEKAAGMKETFERAGGGVKGFFAVVGENKSLAMMAGGIAAVIAMMKRGVEQFAETEKAVTQLDATMARSGQMTDENREKVQELAKQYEETTGIANEKWLSVMATLIKFGSTTEVINQHAEAVKNLAAFLETDVTEAAFMFGKAMQGNTEMLARYGIHVDASKSKTEQLDQIMRQAAARGGGQMEANTRTLTGLWTQSKLALDDFFRGLGNIISQSGILQGTLMLLTGALHAINYIWPQTIAHVEGMTNKLPALTGVTHEAADALNALDKSAEGSANHGFEIFTEALEHICTATDKAIARIEALMAAQDELDDRQKAADIAQLKLQQSLEGNNGQKADRKAFYAQKIADVEAASEQRKMDREEFAIQQKREENEEERRRIKGKVLDPAQTGLDNAKAGAKAAGTAADFPNGIAPGYIEALNQKLDAAIAQLDEKLERLRGFYKVLGVQVMPDGPREEDLARQLKEAKENKERIMRAARAQKALQDAESVANNASETSSPKLTQNAIRDQQLDFQEAGLLAKRQAFLANTTREQRERLQKADEEAAQAREKVFNQQIESLQKVIDDQNNSPAQHIKARIEQYNLKLKELKDQLLHTFDPTEIPIIAQKMRDMSKEAKDKWGIDLTLPSNLDRVAKPLVNDPSKTATDKPLAPSGPAIPPLPAGLRPGGKPLAESDAVPKVLDEIHQAELVKNKQIETSTKNLASLNNSTIDLLGKMLDDQAAFKTRLKALESRQSNQRLT